MVDEAYDVDLVISRLLELLVVLMVLVTFCDVADAHLCC